MEICSRTLQFFLLSFSATWSSKRLIPRSCSWYMPQWPPDSRREHVCGCWYIAVHSAAQQITVFLGKERVGKAKTSKALQTQTGWLNRLCRRWSRRKLKDKTRTALSSVKQWKDVLSVSIWRCWVSAVLPWWYHHFLLVFNLFHFVWDQRSTWVLVRFTQFHPLVSF